LVEKYEINLSKGRGISEGESKDAFFAVVVMFPKRRSSLISGDEGQRRESDQGKGKEGGTTVEVWGGVGGALTIH